MKQFLFSLMILAVGATSFASENTPLSIQSHMAEGSGFHVTSHLISGKKEAILVDAQFTISEASKVVAMVKASGRELKTILITHAHPDHYFGLETVLNAFPNAKAVATPEVIQEIQQTGEGKLAYWKKLYGDELPNKVTLPTAIHRSFLTLEGEDLPLVTQGPGESAHAVALYLPNQQALVAGDLIFNEVHLWLAEDRPEAWIENLDLLTKVGRIKTIYPGHGENGSESLITENKKYIETFLEVTSQSATAKDAQSKLETLFPQHRLPIIVELSTQARVK